MTRRMDRLVVAGYLGPVITVFALAALDRAGASDLVLLPCATVGFTVSFVLMEPRLVRKPAMVLVLAGYSAAFAGLVIWYKELGIPGWLVGGVGISGGIFLLEFFRWMDRHRE